MDLDGFYYILAAFLVLLGIAGTVLPALPGLPLVFVGMLLASWVSKFEKVGWITLTILGLLTLLSMVVDFAATAMGAKRVGASKLAIVGSVIGTFAGLFFGLIGVFIGPFVGALVGEWIHTRQLDQATKVGVGTWVGIVVGTVFKLGLAFAMVGAFAIAWFV
ncbi:membrane protein [Lysobacter enzymogenes]|uniref:Membrane protein n=1 Tax=Lysobacter enzymogenes TaxID=69 RepID=A0A0S2DIE2_LYSEN|nr:DUF456 domain-containing protein [Lysobacter enzymogenes]ALN58411.1 membrane protein [Lysobacter enzymogenes]QCW26807.1 DUF456 domain-containing protein [Lysobacter enzymogenes]UZW62834.1 DUF456 domain-containing protein [Lysobacter enzymogenes]